MKSVIGLDAAFFIPAPEMPIHVGSFNLCALPAGFQDSFHEVVMVHIGKFTHLASINYRSVITLGAPFAGSHKSTNVWRMCELAIGRKIAQESHNYDLPAGLLVPTSSIRTPNSEVKACWQPDSWQCRR